MNEYTQACRSNPFVGSKMKKDAEEMALIAMPESQTMTHHVYIFYSFFEKNKRRDLDNISGFAHKIIQDALVKKGILANDGWADIKGFEDKFNIDKDNPRIEVTVCEARDD